MCDCVIMRENFFILCMCVDFVLFFRDCVFRGENGLVITIGLDFDLLYLICSLAETALSPHIIYLNL